MKVFAILLLVCLSAIVVSGDGGQGGIIKAAIRLACDGLIPVIVLALEILIQCLRDLISGVLHLVAGLLGVIPIVGGIIGGVLNLNDCLTAVLACFNIRTALLGTICGPHGLLDAIDAALCG
jgi:hypothetical protein